MEKIVNYHIQLDHIKTPNSLEKTVQVAFGEYEQEIEPELKINFDIPSKIFLERK